MLLRAIRYCSTFESYLKEHERLRVSLLLNKYSNKIIDEQLKNVLLKFKIDESLVLENDQGNRQKIINSRTKEKAPVDYAKTIFVHFTYCVNMRTFPHKFHSLSSKHFGESPINEIIPILGTRNVNNLPRRLVHTR
ncbi:unnamed protein product [Rotaria sp. Silwood1]|nr:unnamed protein product [Rotaria sp. Silwood1]